MVSKRRVSRAARISRAALAAAAAGALLATAPSASEAFAPPPERVGTAHPNANFRRRAPPRPRVAPYPPPPRPSSTSLHLLGQDGGILGVGAPEIAVTLLVGYFILGPSELYKLVKEIGKFVQNFRTLGAEAAKSFEGTMENQLELTELRKAQAELNDAFSFRRSINTDQYGEAFAENSFAENTAAAAAGAAAATATAGGGAKEEGGAATKKKRRLVRRKKKKVEEAVEEAEEADVPNEDNALKEYPDLDMLDADLPGAGASNATGLSDEEKLRVERLERLSADARSDPASSAPDWFTASEEEVASTVLDHPNKSVDPALESYQKQRFQSQLSVDEWNAQIMANEDKLSPLSMVMKRLAILEEEKNAADKLLEEEYKKRMDNEDKYYLEKRRALEDAITEIQEGVYGGGGNESEGAEVVGSNATKTAT